MCNAEELHIAKYISSPLCAEFCCPERGYLKHISLEKMKNVFIIFPTSFHVHVVVDCVVSISGKITKLFMMLCSL